MFHLRTSLVVEHPTLRRLRREGTVYGFV